jgi:hypothetical protein
LHRLQDGAGVDYLEVHLDRHHPTTTDPDPRTRLRSARDGPGNFRAFTARLRGRRREFPIPRTEAWAALALTFVTPGGARWGAAIFDLSSTTR